MSRLIHASDRRVTQVLASGLTVRQDFATSARFVFFDTGDPAWHYATHGGTVFVLNYKGKPYGITCGHVLKDFSWQQLVVTDAREGTAIAGLRAVYYASQPREEAIDTDLLDIVVVEFSDDVDVSFFTDAAYIVDHRTVVPSSVGDTLHVAGALKTESKITDTTIAPIYCRLELLDVQSTSVDFTLRRAIGKFETPEFADVLGLSGSPVFNVTRNGLAGVVVRARMDAGECVLWYVDIFDVAKLLATVHAGEVATYYRKLITRPND